MTEVHRQLTKWHDPSCSSVDVIQTPTFVACLSCGSSGPPPPPALHLPLPDDSSIRLLVLLSGDFDDPIKCHLRVCSLSSTLIFSAISYTWADENGDDRKCEQIILDGQAFQVSRNCHTALKRVRQVTHTAAVWIDAICIDQYNTKERGHQVKLMSQIYLRAQKVFVYVGEHDNESRNLIDWIEQFSQLQSLGSVKAPLWPELALAKNAIVLCGDSFLAWDCLAKYNRHRFRREKQHPIFMFERSLYLSPNRELLLLDHGRRAQATDPRDKIYGLLGLLPAKCLGSIVADYTLSVEQLYVQVALEIAKLHGWKAVLDRAGTARQQIPSLPSWAPDWSFAVESQTMVPELNPKPLQYCVSDRNQIELKLAKHPGDDDKWLLLDESKGPLNAYFFFECRNVFYTDIIRGRPDTKHMLRFTNQAWQLSLIKQPSLDRTARLLCTTADPIRHVSVHLRLTDAIQAFPLTQEELGRMCANDECIIHLNEATSAEADESPSSVLETLWDEYFRLCAAGPVEDWVLEAEELWVREAERLRPLGFRHYWIRRRGLGRKSDMYNLDGELYAANDAFWRLLVRRFALREQVVHIA